MTLCLILGRRIDNRHQGEPVDGDRCIAKTESPIGSNLGHPGAAILVSIRMVDEKNPSYRNSKAALLQEGPDEDWRFPHCGPLL